MHCVNGACEAIERCKTSLTQLKSVLVEGDHAGQPFVDGVKERIHAAVQIVNAMSYTLLRCCQSDAW